MKKLTITSILALCMACPAMANIDKDASTATCDSNTIGTTTGPANLQADWTANTIHLDWYSNDTKQTSTTCTYDGGITLPSTPDVPTGYTFGGWKVRAAAAPTLNLSSIIGTEAGASYAYVNGNNNFTEDSASYGQSFYGLSTSDPMAFAVNYGNNGIIHGHAACSTTPGTAKTSEPYSFSTESSITDQTGTEGAKYCWCHVDGYTPKDGTLQSVSSSWVFQNEYIFSGTSNCTSYCARDCAQYLQNAASPTLAFRAAVLGSVQ